MQLCIQSSKFIFFSVIRMQYEAENFPTSSDELSALLIQGIPQTRRPSVEDCAEEIMQLAQELESGTLHRSHQLLQETRQRLSALQIEFDLAHIASHIEADPTPNEVMRAEILSLIDTKYDHVRKAATQCHQLLSELLAKAA